MTAEAHPERVPKALFDGLLAATRLATWTPTAVRAWWAEQVASTRPEDLDFVTISRHLDEAVYGLKDKVAKQRRWDRYCRDDLHPKRILLGLERCAEQGTLDRATVSRLQDEYLRHIDAHGKWID